MSTHKRLFSWCDFELGEQRILFRLSCGMVTFIKTSISMYFCFLSINTSLFFPSSLHCRLQHTDVDVPHFTDEDHNFVKGAFHTIDRPYDKLDPYVPQNCYDISLCVYAVFLSLTHVYPLFLSFSGSHTHLAGVSLTSFIIKLAQHTWHITSILPFHTIRHRPPPMQLRPIFPKFIYTTPRPSPRHCGEFARDAPR